MEAVKILQLIDQDPVEIDTVEFERLLRGLISNRTFHLESGVHDGLLASGELDLIRDEKLRNRLAAWPSYVAEWSEEEDMVFSFVDQELVPHLSDRIRLRNVARVFPKFPDGESPAPVPNGSREAGIPGVISSSIEFDNLVYRRAQGTWHAMLDGETLRAQLTTIISLLQQNLDT